MAIVACDDDRVCRLRPYDRALCTLVYLRKHDTFEQLAARFGVGVATAWRYLSDTIEGLAVFAPSLTESPDQSPRRRLCAAGRHRRGDRPGPGQGTLLREGPP
ncbi:transposase family protein [Streptomyces sp. ET3-23]|uniref:helix-turn-helix domain-containing protein n=1 Tax=Streptomyces sp. ET3-23 TaxID=2885643 RepID=UPI001D10E573|nr:transposase family protein [Streptomyces sp. ET3-23]MCC2280973.1 transposase family protein [Streptomyces sp. ET3-23]